jgi:predicted ATPase
MSAAWESAIDRSAASVRNSEESDYIPLGRGPVPGVLWQWVSRECRSWRPLELLPDAMRLPVPGSGADRGGLRQDGANLALVLDRVLQAGLLDDFNVDLAALVPGVCGVQPLFDKRRFEYDFDVLYDDGRPCPPTLVSEGTLRVLALLAANYDPRPVGVLAVEELENGLHPRRLAEVLRRLKRDLADYTGAPAPAAAPLKQLLLTTHSPVLMSALRDEPDGTVVFVERATRFGRTAGPGHPVTVARPVLRDPSPDADPGTFATDYEVRQMLDSVGRPER